MWSQGLELGVETFVSALPSNVERKAGLAGLAMLANLVGLALMVGVCWLAWLR